MEGLGFYIAIVFVLFVYHMQTTVRLIELENEIYYLQEMIRQQNKNLKPEVIAKAILEAKIK